MSFVTKINSNSPACIHKVRNEITDNKKVLIYNYLLRKRTAHNFLMGLLVLDEHTYILAADISVPRTCALGSTMPHFSWPKINFSPSSGNMFLFLTL